ncbi:MAG: phosphotransferase, partial [Gammaproteobacteria bacterium]|nr:phosphotransferase [Gammaproteobacteria bacterium]
LTNRNYRVDCERGSFVLRLAGEGTSDYIDRKAELYNATIASNAGVNAKIVHFNVDTGTMICSYIDNARTMGIEAFRDLSALRRVSKAFRQLHDCGQDFQGSFALFEQIDQYLAVLRDLNTEPPDGFADVQKGAEQVRAALSRHVLPVKPCHCDPMVENCIDDGQRVFIIDFEYAGNNDPMWDLGDLSVEGDFTDEQDRVLLETYFGHSPSAFDAGRMVMYKAMCDLLWTLWAVVQHAHKNPVDDFWAYALGRLERCRKLMASVGFSQHLEAVKQGRA